MTGLAPGQGPASPAVSVHAAIRAAAIAYVPLTDLVGQRIYSLRAPSGAKLDYVVLSDTNEGDWSAFMRRGAATEIQIHIFSQDGESIMPALDIYNALKKLLDGTDLPLVDHLFARGRLTLTTVIPDPPSSGSHAIASYVVQSRVAP